MELKTVTQHQSDPWAEQPSEAESRQGLEDFRRDHDHYHYELSDTHTCRKDMSNGFSAPTGISPIKFLAFHMGRLGKVV